jgi:hypothetical protein
MKWNAVMKMRISPQAVARTILSNFETVKPLTKEEAEQVQLALNNSGVTDATTRLTAGFSRAVLKMITQQ